MNENSEDGESDEEDDTANTGELVNEKPVEASREYPEGNLYRGWAIGVHTIKESPTEFHMTVLVGICQVLAPAFMVIWARRKLKNKSPVYTWQCSWPWPALFEIEDDLRRSPEELANRCIIDWQGVRLEVLGLLLMMLLFLNGDNLLDRQEAQTIKLRQLYGSKLKRGWMLTDAFCNSCCVGISAIAIYPLLVLSSDIKDLLLDAFGLLFLYTLANYRSMLEFGIDPADFDLALQAQREAPFEERDETWCLCNESTEPWFRAYMCSGDILFAVARIVNMWWGYFSLILYLLIHWVDVEDNERAFKRRGMAIWFFDGCNVVRVSTLVTITLHYAWKAWRFYNDDDGKKDFTGFIFAVLLRRSDPRSTPTWSIRKSQTSTV